MKLFTRRDKRTCLEKEIDSALMKMSDYDVEKDSLSMAIETALEEMSAYEPGSEKYSAILHNVETLCKAKKDAKEISYTELATTVETLCKAQSAGQTRKINANTLITVLGTIFGSLLGIIAIVGAEYVGNISSKALGFVMKGRV